MIILHGLFGSADNWAPIATRLSDAFQVFALDQRNHGRSPHSGEMNYAVMAADVRQFLDEQSMESAIVLGHSMGGKTAMRFALDYPARTQALIVADMAPRAYPPLHASIFEALLRLDLASFSSRNQVSDALAADIPDAALRLFLLKMIGRGPAGQMFWQTNIRGIEANSAHLRAALPGQGSYPGPALFIRAEKSDYLRDDDAAPIRQLFPSAEFKAIPRVGHWVHAEAPDAFCAALREFLGKS
jgi:pimeloyl-ACP methyl ester carboxylesterase